ncbi:hypothetical protein WMF39_35530 [Sorangium sp. So ce1504]|uniref:hypothetical protein n=1 Tax=Sorangium sp. So ce1504 TaxID=3133337 RepID=UPI003F5F1FBA
MLSVIGYEKPGRDWLFRAILSTPAVVNTLTPRLPFVGIVTELFQRAPSARPCHEVFGAPRGRIFGKRREDRSG